MKKNKWIIIFVFISIIIGIVLLSKKEVMNKFTFPTELVVENNTPYKGIDTVAMVILNNMMKFDTINLYIFDIKDGVLKYGDIDIIAYVEKIPYNNHKYTLFIGNNIYNINDVIAHEMAHIEQMEKGDLIQPVSRENFVIYKNDTIFYLKTPYDIRSFEIDAVKRQKAISNDLYKLLYK